GGNSLRDTDDEPETGVGRLHDGVGGERWWDEDDRCVRAGLFDRIVNRVENRPSFVGRPALARRHAADDRGPVGRRLLRVEGAFAAGQTLNNQARRLIDQYRHSSLGRLVATKPKDTKSTGLLVEN